jgi:hypothetical protein
MHTGVHEMVNFLFLPRFPGQVLTPLSVRLLLLLLLWALTREVQPQRQSRKHRSSISQVPSSVPKLQYLQ